MVLPARRPPTREATELGRAPRRRWQGIINHGAAPTEAIERIEVFRHVPAVLAESGEITAQDGDPEGQRLDKWKPKPFGKRWQQ